MKIKFLLFFLFLSIGNSFAQINNEHLTIGETAPQIIGIDQFGVTIDSNKILEENKILLLFYRGNWCPYCKKQLLSLEENLQRLTDKGIFVIVVTPEKVEKVKETTEKWGASFSIIHDVDNKIMNDYKVAFEVNEQSVLNYLNFTQKKIEEYNEINNNILPVPATYLIEKNHKINYVHYDPDYKIRTNISELLINLE